MKNVLNHLNFFYFLFFKGKKFLQKALQAVVFAAKYLLFLAFWLHSALQNVKTKKKIVKISALYALFDSMEIHPIYFSVTGISAFQLFNYSALLEYATFFIQTSPSTYNAELLYVWHALERRMIALRYRLEGVNGGWDKSSVNGPIVNKLKMMVREWKHTNDLIENKELTEDDLYNIQLTSQYPAFVALLRKDEKIKEEYLLWAFRDKNSPAVFIEFPGIQQKIVVANLSGRIGRMNNNLKIKKVINNFGMEKIVTLPFEGKEISILDEKTEVTLTRNYQLSVGEVLQIFKDKTSRAGNLEYLAHGVTNWNVQKWGRWNPAKSSWDEIDLTHNEWWHQLPLTELISKEQAFERYGQRYDSTQWIVAATATRGSSSLDYENTHAFFEIAIPWGDGRYATFNFGKTAILFPSTFFESLLMFCKNSYATVVYPDENIFYTHRQQVYHSFGVTPKEGEHLMAIIKEDMKKAKESNFVYQIESENCAKWVHESIEKVIGEENVPDMFRMHLLDTEPVGLVAKIFKWMKKLPAPIQTPILVFCHLPLGAMRKTRIVHEGKAIYTSLTQHDFWKTGTIYLPAMLHTRKKLGLLDQMKQKVSKRVLHYRPHALYLAFVFKKILKKSRAAFLFFRNHCHVFRIRAFSILLSQKQKLFFSDPMVSVRNLFKARDLKPLSTFYCLDKQRGLQERFVRSSIQPRHSTAQYFHVKSAVF